MSFPSIEQFRNTVEQVRRDAEQEGVEPPTLCAVGTVKIHGTNGGVELRDGKIICHSRRREITPEDDNLGFAQFVYANEHIFRDLFYKTGGGAQFIYGEWCGKGIQKGVAVNELDRMFVIFGIRRLGGHWVDLTNYGHVEAPEARIFNIARFARFIVDIDFSNPGPSRDEMERYTLQVEERCPVGSHFGVEGIGEGIVWTFPEINSPRLWFKTKGEKHRIVKPKSKRVIEITPERAANIQEFVDATVTEQRLLQGVSVLREDGKPIGPQSTGDFLKWVASDILKEEADRLEVSGLEKKDVTKAISAKARAFWLDMLKYTL